MRRDVDDARIRELLRRLGRRVSEPTTCYLSGGATAILYGWRATSRDVDMRFEPDRDEIFDAVRELKEQLQTNIEFASPVDFIPMPDGWRDRSPMVAREGELTVRHLDPRAQALAKVERWHPLDREDVAAMLDRGLVTADELRAAFDEIAPQLVRFPAIDVSRFRSHLDAATGRP